MTLQTHFVYLFGKGCMTPTQNEAYAVARLTKSVRSRSLVILGGVHASFKYEELLTKVSDIDLVVIGEGEIMLGEICKAWDGGLTPTKLSEIHGIAFRVKKDSKQEKRSTW